MKPIGACIFVVYFLMIFASLVRFYVFVMPPGGSKMLAVDVSIVPYQWLGWSPSYREVLTPVQLLPRLQNDDHHHHTQAATTTTPQTSLAMDQEEKKQVQSIIDQLKGHSLPDGGEIVGSINSSSSEFNATNNRARIVRQYESGSTASDRKSTRETPDRKGITFAVSVCILLAIYLFCSKVSLRLRIRSSTQTSASQQVEIVEHIKVRIRPSLSEPRRIGLSLSAPRRICLKKRVPAPPVPAPPIPAPQPKVPKKRKLAKGKGRVTLENLQQYFGHKRADVAAILGVSVSTFKRMCRLQGITRWRNQMGSSGSVSKPPYQHGEGNTSTARETPSHNVQTGMEGEPVGQNQEANECRRDFMGGPIALNTESGLIMVSRPPDQHGERNTSTACETPSRNVETEMEVEPVGQNPEANVFRRDLMGGPIALNTDGLTFPECSDAVAHSQPMATILDTIPHLTGCSSECAFQVKNQSTQFTSNQYPNGLVDPHPQIALTQILSENMERLEDRRNLLAPLKEPLPEGHVFGSVNWTVRSCSDLALSQPMPTIPHTTGGSEYWRNSLALLEKHLLEENDYGSINLTALSCFDPGPSQPMHTIPHTMPTIPQMMPLLTKRLDMTSVRLKATYGNTTIKFPLPSGYSELKEEVSKRLEFERGSFKLEYKDEEGDSVLIACDEDLRDYLQLLTSLGNQVVKLFVLDKVPNTTNFCDN